MKTRYTLIFPRRRVPAQWRRSRRQPGRLRQGSGRCPGSPENGFSMGNQWRDSGKLLKKAGDFAKAVTLAQAVRLQGKIAQQQPAKQAHAGNPSYLY